MAKAKQFWTDDEVAHFKFLIEKETPLDKVRTDLKEKFGTERNNISLNQKRYSDTFKKAAAREVTEPQRPRYDAPTASSKKTFNTAVRNISREKKQKVANHHAKALADTDELFKPVYPATIKKKDVVFYPGIGPVVCTNIGRQTVAGFDLETFTLEEQYPVQGKKIIHVPKSQINKREIRLLSSKAALEAILEKMEQGTQALKFVKNFALRTAYLDERIASSQLISLCELSQRAFRSAALPKDVAQTDVIYGNRALEMLSAEYAAVYKIPINDAKKVIATHSGKQGITNKHLDLDEMAPD